MSQFNLTNNDQLFTIDYISQNLIRLSRSKLYEMKKNDKRFPRAYEIGGSRLYSLLDTLEYINKLKADGFKNV